MPDNVFFTLLGIVLAIGLLVILGLLANQSIGSYLGCSDAADCARRDHEALIANIVTIVVGAGVLVGIGMLATYIHRRRP
ncbi:MAG: hypothetical protein U0W40_06100 [Acidimicrobiia bacterium]